MGEALITRRGGGGGDAPKTYDIELSMKDSSTVRVLLDTNSWDAGAYLIVCSYKGSNYALTLFNASVVKKTNGDLSYDSSGCGIMLATGLTYSPNRKTASGVTNWSPSPGVYRLDFSFSSSINSSIQEIFYAKAYKFG